MQKVTLIGYLGGDPEVHQGQDGSSFTTFSVGCSEGTSNNKYTAWWSVSASGKTGENAAKFLKKGRQVYIEGTPRQDRSTGTPTVYQKKDGTVAANQGVFAFKVVYLGGGSDDGQGQNQQNFQNVQNQFSGQPQQQTAPQNQFGQQQQFGQAPQQPQQQFNQQPQVPQQEQAFPVQPQQQGQNQGQENPFATGGGQPQQGSPQNQQW